MKISNVVYFARRSEQGAFDAHTSVFMEFIRKKFTNQSQNINSAV